MQVYGGFAGTENSLSQRNVVVNLTILSGDIGTPSDNSDNSFQVVTTGSDGSSTVLDGFTITAGNADGYYPYFYGGGLYNANGSLTLSNLTFSDNSADYGGGLYNANGSPTLSNVTFSDNSAADNGGGLYNGGSPTLSNVTFSGNYAADNGGGLYSGGSPTLSNVTFSGNHAADIGGGLYNISSSTLTSVTFSANSATTGGGFVNVNGSPTLSNVTFSGNSAASVGGGMLNAKGSVTLTNVEFSGNSALYGGGLVNEDQATLTNVTISGNSATGQGGGLDNTGSATLTNCILWGDGGEISGGATVSDSDVQGGFSGTGNLNANPLFVDAAHGNLHLLVGSPCIDTGTNSGAPAFDLDGTPRPIDGDGNGTAITDMGAVRIHSHTQFQRPVLADHSLRHGNHDARRPSRQRSITRPVRRIGFGDHRLDHLDHHPGQQRQLQLPYPHRLNGRDGRTACHHLQLYRRWHLPRRQRQQQFTYRDQGDAQRPLEQSRRHHLWHRAEQHPAQCQRQRRR